MSLEKQLGGDEEPIRVRSLSAAPPIASERPFDAVRDLPSSDWQAMKRTLGAAKQSQQWAGFAQIAAALRAMDPSHDIAAGSQVPEGLLATLDEDRSHRDWGATLFLAANIRVVDPSWDLGLADWEWAEIQKYAAGERSVSPYRFSQVAVALRIANPSIALPVTEEDRAGMVATLQRHRSGKNGSSIAFLGGALRTLCPDYDPHFTEAEWRVMHDTLAGYRQQSDWYTVGDMAADMQKLAAPHEPDLAPATPAMPIDRNFK